MEKKLWIWNRAKSTAFHIGHAEFEFHRAFLYFPLVPNILLNKTTKKGQQNSNFAWKLWSAFKSYLDFPLFQFDTFLSRSVDLKLLSTYIYSILANFLSSIGMFFSLCENISPLVFCAQFQFFVWLFKASLKVEKSKVDFYKSKTFWMTLFSLRFFLTFSLCSVSVFRQIFQSGR